MKILLVCENYYPHIGGAEIVFQTLAEGLVKAGHQVAVVTHQLKNTNQLIVGEDWLADLVVGSKTGQTDLAKKNLIVVLRAPRLGGYLVAVVLGAEDHFAAMRELIAWAVGSYKF